MNRRDFIGTLIAGPAAIQSAAELDALRIPQIGERYPGSEYGCEQAWTLVAAESGCVIDGVELAAGDKILWKGV